MTAAAISVPAQVTGFIGDPSVLFVVSHSGGKDSQAMLIDVRAMSYQSSCTGRACFFGDIEWSSGM
jgi:hypothetical protein